MIYQACLRQPHFEGFADFLIKLPGKSRLGEHYYEVWDTKLARSVKPYYAIQLCAYAEMLERIQGIRPAEVCVYLGRDKDPEQRLVTSKFFYYYRHLRKTFERYNHHNV